jgi:hypothetical protein
MVDVEKAAAALRDENPGLIVLLADLCAAAKAVKAVNVATTAKDRETAWSRMETILVQLVKASGADDALLGVISKRAMTPLRPARSE